MKKLVVYYSLSGNTAFIAGAIAGAVGADILELNPAQDLNPKSFTKYFWAGRQVFMRKCPQLAAFDKQPQEYDFLFIGTPVWAFSYTPAIRTFLTNVKLEGKKIALFCCHGGGPGKTLKKIERDLPGNIILGGADFVEPLNSKADNKEKSVKWAKDINAQFLATK